MGRTYYNEINRIFASPGGPVGKELRKTAMEIAAEAKAQAIATFGKHPGDKPRTGNLAKAYQVRVIPGTNQFVVLNRKKYAAAMELGARPHIIRARKKTGYLHFRDRNGYWRKVKFVNHPGSVARKTLWTSARIVMQRRYGVS